MCSENGDEPTTSTGRRLGRALSALLTAVLLAAPSAQARPDLEDPRNPLVPPPAPAVQEVDVVTADGFDWADAGIGAGIAAGVALLTGAGVAAALTRRRHLPRVS
jgi:hypothetical protein